MRQKGEGGRGEGGKGGILGYVSSKRMFNATCPSCAVMTRHSMCFNIFFNTF